MFADTTLNQLDIIGHAAAEATAIFRKKSLENRAALMKDIARALEENEKDLVSTAMQETNLPEARLKNELGRTCFQLRSYADFCESGQWMDLRIDHAHEQKNPPKPDIRKMMTAIGPVVVFGASNFPFAYSTAGGDTACAFAAGCAVIVKAHPAHAHTSQRVADIISAIAKKHNLPQAVFSHVHGSSSAVGEALVKHPAVKAVGFTGSFAGGKQIFDWGCGRSEPIPVFAEMGSVNPVFLLPEKLKTEAKEYAKKIAGSITLGVGQFCTKPGIIVGINSPELEVFTDTLKEEMNQVPAAPMLHEGIYKNYISKKEKLVTEPAVKQLTVMNPTNEKSGFGSPALAIVTAKDFQQNALLHEEVFGPYSIIVQCENMREMQQVAQTMQGQLTATVIATEEEMLQNLPLSETLQNICGRFILNAVPTGVEVCLSMQHGGPFPACTDSRFSSVGADGIRRFARPIAFQNWPGQLLPDELKEENPLGLWRTVNNVPGKY